jgi:hypothetical protein
LFGSRYINRFSLIIDVLFFQKHHIFGSFRETGLDFHRSNGRRHLVVHDLIVAVIVVSPDWIGDSYTGFQLFHCVSLCSTHGKGTSIVNAK